MELIAGTIALSSPPFMAANAQSESDYGYNSYEKPSYRNNYYDEQPEYPSYKHDRYYDDWPNIHENVITDFNPTVAFPEIEDTAFIHPFAVVIGACYIGELMVAPTAVCRGDEGTPIYISAFSNVQDDVVIHALETTKDGVNIDNRRYSADGELLSGDSSKFEDGYAVFVGEETSLAHGTLVHGPAYIGHNTFVGMESLVFNAKVGNNVAVGVGSIITTGNPTIGIVEIPDDKFVPPGSVITTQQQANNLPDRVGSPYENINPEVVTVNK